MSFDTEVIGCKWNEDKGEWTVRLRESKPGQQSREFEDHCHLLLHGSGILNNFKACRPCDPPSSLELTTHSGPTSPAWGTSSKAE